MKYFIVTHGCQMNVSDSERIATIFKKMKLRPAKDIEQADLIIINMCSVRQSAVDRTFGLISKIKNKKTVLTGCILKKDKKKFEEKFDYILDIKDLSNWPKILYSCNLAYGNKNYFKIKPDYSNKFTALIPIMTGCNNFCSYCVVPYTRKKEISRTKKEIIKEIRFLIKKGVKEIWLLGQNVNSYGKNRDDFPKLLETIDKIPGNFWIRFTSSHPKDFSDKLIKSMKKCSKVTPYLNLPVQSGDNQILKKMNRSYKIKNYKEIISKIKKEIPDITLSTDIIVGFPGETKKQFENTKKLFQKVKFDMAYINKYSSRPGTAAFKLKDDVSEKEKKKREKTLTDILKKTALEKNKKFIGKTVKVLVEEYKKGFLFGKSFHYKTTKFKGSKSLVGSFINVRITSVLPFSLNGEIERAV